MKNFLYKFWVEMSNHNRYKSIAAIVCLCLLCYFHGCQIKTHSIMNPTEMVTVAELQMEIDNFNTLMQDRIADVNSQLKFRDFLWDSALTVATAGTFDWLAFLTSAGSVIGAGALADNIRYRIATAKKST